MNRPIPFATLLHIALVTQSKAKKRKFMRITEQEHFPVSRSKKTNHSTVYRNEEITHSGDIKGSIEDHRTSIPSTKNKAINLMQMRNME